ncbi:hypothetical protein ACHAXT_003742 [Thalassiosira profunda]
MILNRLLLLPFVWALSESTAEDDGDELVSWLRENGAFINPKLSIEQLSSDPNSPRGVFANEALEEGETVCRIPYHLIIGPSAHLSNKRPDSDCDTVDAVFEAISGDDITPYGKYLLAQPRNSTPGFWSESAKEWLMEILDTEKTSHMTEYDELPPHGIEDFTAESKCRRGDMKDPLYRHAAMLVKSRSDFEFMVPYYDLMNHNNGRTNVRHRYDPYDRSVDIEQTGYEIVTTRRIGKGDELFNSYNQCSICSARYDWFGTPEMFLHYGFVEPFPQRWLIDFARMKFDIVWKDGDELTGEMAVNFLVPPSEKGISLLREEVARLESYAAEWRHTDYTVDPDLTREEWDALWHYTDALHNALSLAVGSNADLTDDVWALSDDWWVQEGTLVAANTDEHEVEPTVHKNLFPCSGARDRRNPTIES